MFLRPLAGREPPAVFRPISGARRQQVIECLKFNPALSLHSNAVLARRIRFGQLRSADIRPATARIVILINGERLTSRLSLMTEIGTALSRWRGATI
jgi:hypothetical protein